MPIPPQRIESLCPTNCLIDRSDMTRHLAAILLLPFLMFAQVHGSNCDDFPCDACREFEFQLIDRSEWMVSGQYLMWWSDGADAPPLVSTSDDGSPRADAGVIGNPTTEVLFGGEGLNRGLRNGIRILADRKVNADWRIYGEGFYVGDDDDQYSASSTGLPILARPYVSAQTLANDSELVAFPNVLSGQIDVETSSQIFGFEIGASTVLSEDERARISLFGGYRFIQFEDSVSIEENLESTDPGGLVALGTTFRVNDDFDARNQFHGVNFRLDIQKRFQKWELSLQPSLALGSIERDVSISGSTR
ncbi:MAG: BBP7 family outer membrane beta-barrel protein, partial [Planctomycetota bacterium]